MSVCASRLCLLVCAIQMGLSEGFKHANEDTKIWVIFPLFLKGDTILHLEHHFDIPPSGGRALLGIALKRCPIDFKESFSFALYNLSSLVISSTNLQQDPCLMQTLCITYRPAWALSIIFWRIVQFCGIPGIRCFHRVFAALEQLTISQHGSSSPDRHWLRILIPPRAASLPPQTIHTKCISCGESYNVLCS